MDNCTVNLFYVQEILTKKEFTVFKYLMEGKTNKEIAEDMVVTQHTIKAHVSAILKKLKVKRRVDLIIKYKK